MTELEYVIRHGGLTPKPVLQAISRRGFAARVLGGLTPTARLAGNDFTIAIIPDPQYLAEFCPDNSGRYYAAMMKWIVDNKNIAKIKAVGGSGRLRECDRRLSIQKHAGRLEYSGRQSNCIYHASR